MFSYSPASFVVVAGAVSYPAVNSQQPEPPFLFAAGFQYVLMAFILLSLLVIFSASAFLYNSSLSVPLSAILCVHTFQQCISRKAGSVPRLTMPLTMLERGQIFKLTFLHVRQYCP